MDARAHDGNERIGDTPVDIAAGQTTQGVEAMTRVSSLELFFDLVFVFTITQLTAILAAGGDFVSTAEVLVLLLLIWWMYDGYAWLTNNIAPS